MPILVEPVSCEACLPIRHQVLWPDLPPQACRLPDDDAALHLGAHIDGKLVGVASLCALGAGRFQLRKFAVLADFQGQGVGRVILETALATLRESGAVEMCLDARQSAADFYRRAGLTRVGEPFLKQGLQYIRMRIRMDA